jgi:membrane-bound lytic murein transglycosylase B
MERLAADGFNRGELAKLFARLGPNSYSPAYMAAKITELYGVAGIGIRRDNAPSPETPQDFLPPVDDVTVRSCLKFLQEHADELNQAEKRHGVPPSVILAVLVIETRLGLDLGSDTALRALACMAATSDLDMLSGSGNLRQTHRVGAGSLRNTLREKSQWAYGELTSLLRYARSNGYDAATIPCSVYGAIGLCQFMPSNISLFAVDGNGDGKIDLFSPPDAIYSVAKYLEANGWRNAKSDRQKQAVIYTYNHDNGYALSVLATSRRLDQAQKGKISLQSNALVGGPSRYNPYARLDPSLRRGRHVPRKAMLGSLGDYQTLLQ